MFTLNKLRISPLAAFTIGAGVFFILVAICLLALKTVLSH